MYIGLHVEYRYSCQVSIKLEISQHISKNTQVSHSTKICLVGGELFHADRQTDMTKLLVFSHNFAKVHKKDFCLTSMFNP